MPNWEGFSTLNKKIKDSQRNLSYIYTNSYYNEKTDSISKLLQDIYLNNYKGRPSEYAYKGFEIMYNFSRILNDNLNQFTKYISEDSYSLFTKYKILPVFNEKKTRSIDYFENKQLYYLRKGKSGISKIE